MAERSIGSSFRNSAVMLIARAFNGRYHVPLTQSFPSSVEWPSFEVLPSYNHFGRYNPMSELTSCGVFKPPSLDFEEDRKHNPPASQDAIY